MLIDKQRFINLHKYPLLVGFVVYLVGVFSPIKTLQPGLVFVFGAGFFNLFHCRYFVGRPKLASVVWLIPMLSACLTYSTPLQQNVNRLTLFAAWLVTMLICAVPFVLLLLGKRKHSPSRKRRLRIINVRIFVQCCVFMIYAAVTAVALIKGTRADLAFWAVFHITTTAILPFLFGRILCSWLCPTATIQDGLLKHMHYRRPIAVLPQAVEAQSHTTAMNTSGPIDKGAPYLPATLLLAFFPMFVVETVFDLTKDIWYPICFLYGLFFLSILLPWRKLCTHFCWLSSYRGLAAHVSLWRLRFNQDKCRGCKRCTAEQACPFFIDIRNQTDEMPATCSVCFGCKEACPYPDVITYRRSKSTSSSSPAQLDVASTNQTNG